MKDYVYLQEICMKEIIDAGILPGKISKWSINSRSKTRWGQCKKIGNTFEISISDRLMLDDRIDEKACKTTIIHEILHYWSVWG